MAATCSAALSLPALEVQLPEGIRAKTADDSLKKERGKRFLAIPSKPVGGGGLYMEKDRTKKKRKAFGRKEGIEKKEASTGHVQLEKKQEWRNRRRKEDWRKGRRKEEWRKWRRKEREEERRTEEKGEERRTGEIGTKKKGLKKWEEERRIERREGE